MGATSVTGRGQGDSNGKQKPKNHITCSCGPSCDDEQEPKEPTKTVCKTRYVSGSQTSIKVGGTTKIRVCS